MGMRHIDLFSGIGGFALAGTWVWGDEYENVGHSEVESYPCKVYHNHFPQSECLGDITKIDWSRFAGTIDLVTGGFPCQSHSVAGKRGGSKDERDLWSECVRAITDVRPKYAIFENVPGLFSSTIDSCVCGWTHRRGGVYKHIRVPWQKDFVLLPNSDSRHEQQGGSSSSMAQDEIWGEVLREAERENGTVGSVLGMVYLWGRGGKFPNGDSAVLDTKTRPVPSSVAVSQSNEWFRSQNVRQENLDRECQGESGIAKTTDAQAEQEGPGWIAGFGGYLRDGEARAICPCCGRSLGEKSVVSDSFFGRALSDLAESGYDAEWQVLSAAEVGAWHRRERVWITAYPRQVRRGTRTCEDIRSESEKSIRENIDNLRGEISYPVNCEHRGRQGQNREANGIQEVDRATVHAGESCGTGEVSDPTLRQDDRRERRDLVAETERRQGIDTAVESGGQNVPDSESAKCEQSGDLWNGWNGFADGSNDATNSVNPTTARQRIDGGEIYAESESKRLIERGCEGWLATEPNLGQLADGLSVALDVADRERAIRVATGVPKRVDQLKALGNAIVPQCAAVIMEAIKTNAFGHNQ